ncbi:hypothetical protein WMY93_020977 [Mugilogobius chulae]|uniref:Bromo domain-containing protein n=1 Tax=Mugilogobius chulae TaxID=88201 RepID=A0AAW0NJY2_9GOBI
MEQKPGTDEISADMTHKAQGPTLDNSNPKWITSTLPDEHGSWTHRAEPFHCQDDSGGVFTEDDHFALSNDGMSELSDISLTEVCISSNTKVVKEEMNYEVQQAYRIFNEFLTEKHKVTTSPFLHLVVNEDQETQHGFGDQSRSPVNVRQSMCLHRMEEKFIQQEYETITEFVADFRLMLENCYRCHGVDHWLSKQAQKLEIMLEQKLTLLSRKLREKTTLAVTSKGRFGVGEERASSSSTRRRQTRRIKTLNVGGQESIMVQALRMEEQQRTRKKKGRRMSAKEMDEWEQNLLSQASPHSVETLWELPAIGHFLCLAQTALNLPEIVFFELERCLLMPRCSILLSKIMSSLLCSPQRRSTLHRRPVLPYRRWESELRQRAAWSLSPVFTVLGESSPLEAKAFHMLPFYQRVWLLKGLCDHVYETQKDIQVANAFIHFPHFCGADLRIYCQSPCTPPIFPLPPVFVKKVEMLHKKEEEMPCHSWTPNPMEHFQKPNDEDTSDECKVEPHTNSSPTKKPVKKRLLIEDKCEFDYKSKILKKEMGSLCPLYCCSDEEHCYTGISPAVPVSQLQNTRTAPGSVAQRDQRPGSCGYAEQMSSDSSRTSYKALIHSKKIKNESFAGPSFKLICSNLDDLRELINKTEDELDALESSKKKMNRWYCRREAVKELHSTLVRLLNELIPWEPKLIKAYQRNRVQQLCARGVRFIIFLLSSSSSDDEDGHMPFEQRSRSGDEDPEHVLPRRLGGTLKDLSGDLSAADTPVTHINYDRQKQALSTTNAHLDQSLKNTCNSELNNQSHSSQKKTVQLINICQTSSGQPKSYTPIPTLLAKSVGNKVTLMKQPADHLEIDCGHGDTKGTVVSTGDTSLLKLNSSSAPPQNCQQKHDVFYTLQNESNQLVGSSNSNVRCEEVKPQQVFVTSNIIHQTDKKVTLLQQQFKSNTEMDNALFLSTDVAGFAIPEDGTLKPVPPSKNTGQTETSLCSSNVPSFLRSQSGAFSSVSSKCDVQTTTPHCTLTITPSSISKSTDSKQELKTVCIRESQSILVTTRGGNTGIVKVQKSSDHTGGFSKSPTITISPQFQAFLVSKASPVLSSNSGRSGATATTASTVQTGAEISSVSLNQEVSKSLNTAKCLGLTDLSCSLSTFNPGKPVTAASCPLAVVKNKNPSFSSLVTAPSVTAAADVISKPSLYQTNKDDASQIAKLFLISPSSSKDVNVSCSKTSSAPVVLVNQQTATEQSSLIPLQCINTVLKPATASAMMASSATPNMSVHTSPVHSASVPKNKAIFVSSGASSDPVQFPCLITTSISPDAQSSTKCRDTEQVHHLNIQPSECVRFYIGRVTSHGLGSLSVQKQEQTVVHPNSPVFWGIVKAVDATLPSKNTTHCPVIVTNPTMEKHLQQTSFLEMQMPVTSKLLVSPDGAVLSAVQGEAKSTLPETPAGAVISSTTFQPSQVDSKFDD